MSATSGQRARLARPGAAPTYVHAVGLAVVAVIAGLAVFGLLRAPVIAFLAAGAGAGYSLSGSV